MDAEVDLLGKGAQDYPPLPDGMSENSRRTTAGKALLADGCYFVAYGLDVDNFIYQGTLRVESRSGRLSASGDLYRFEPRTNEGAPSIGSAPPPCPGIPIFPIDDYRYYMRVTRIEPADTGFALVFEAHRFIPRSFLTLDGNMSPHWTVEGTYTANMAPAAAPPGYPSPEFFFVGDVFTGGDISTGEGRQVGKLQIGWISSVLRKAVIEIDRVPESEVPRGNGAGVTWKSIFDSVGWDVTAIESDSDVRKADGPAWKLADAHAAMLARRDRSNLNAEWRYHILAVQQIAFSGGERGVMYDRNAFNQVPREGLLVSSHYVFPANEARWGALRGVRAGTTVTYFRTAVHELGHALGLDHNLTGFAFMRPTDGIAENAPAAKPFPGNIVWSFAPEDEHQLRHWPDVVVRPGGVDFGRGLDAPRRGARPSQRG